MGKHEGREDGEGTQEAQTGTQNVPFVSFPVLLVVLPPLGSSMRKLRLVLTCLLLALVSISAISVDRLKTDVMWLADPAREGRHAGTPGAAAAADYISRQLKD